jgi:hypothetical protein
VQEDLEEQASHRYREKARSDAELLLKYPMEKEFRKPDEPDPPRPEDFPVQTDELKELEEQAKRRGDMDAARWMSERVSPSSCTERCVKAYVAAKWRVVITKR